MRPQRSYGSKQPSVKSAKASLAMLLSGCRPAQLASFTPAYLAGAYRVTAAEAEKMLAAAKERRG